MTQHHHDSPVVVERESGAGVAVAAVVVLVLVAVLALLAFGGLRLLRPVDNSSDTDVDVNVPGVSPTLIAPTLVAPGGGGGNPVPTPVPPASHLAPAAVWGV